jgi:glycosyltransferase involved in cell wall biosynthesis
MPEAPSKPLSIVIPAYNEADLIEGTLSAVADFIKSRALDAEVLVVDDGSRDGTGDLAAQAISRLGLNGRVIAVKPNAGKANAVRTGVLAASGSLILFSDADLSTPLDEFGKLHEAVANSADIAIASRALPGARLEPPQSWIREHIGRAFALVRRGIILPRIADTQCGFKLFKRDAALAVFPLQTMTSWAFDAEVLFIADRLGYRIAEIPVVWHNRRESKVRVLHDAWKVFRDLVTVRFRHRHLGRKRGDSQLG